MEAFLTLILRRTVAGQVVELIMELAEGYEAREEEDRRD
jgi:hypothetical protein